jgi:acyl carrier protein
MNDSLSNKFREVIAGHFGIDPERLTDESRLGDDLGADWLDRLELMIAIEDQVPGFEVVDVVVDQIDTVGDLMRVFESEQRSGRCVERRGHRAAIGLRWVWCPVDCNVRSCKAARFSKIAPGSPAYSAALRKDLANAPAS